MPNKVNRVERNLSVLLTADDLGWRRGFDSATTRMQRFNRDADRMGNDTNRSFRVPVDGITRLASSLFALDKAFGLVKDGIQVVSNFQRINASLKAVSDSTDDYARTQTFLKSTADQYGLSIEALSKSYAGFKANTNDTILKGAEAERIFLSVAKASASLQLSVDDTTGVLRAFGQMLSKGTVQSEELKGQVGERLYNAFGMAAKAMGVTTMELNKMLQSGQVLATDLLPKLATEIDKTFGANAINNANTISGAWTRATDQLKLFTSEFSEATGIDTFFASIGTGLANTLRGLREVVRSNDFSVFKKFLSGQGRVATTDIQLKGLNKAEIDRFMGLNEKQRVEEMQGMESALQDARTSFNIKDKRGDFSASGLLRLGPFRQSREEAELEVKRMNELADAYASLHGKMSAAEEGAGKKTVTGQLAQDFDALKQKADDLKKQIQDIVVTQGEKAVPAKLIQGYQKVVSLIERANKVTNSVRGTRMTGEFTNLPSLVDYLQKARTAVEEQIQAMVSAGKQVPADLYDKWEALTRKINEAKDALKRTDLSFADKGFLQNTIDKSLADPNKKTQKLEKATGVGGNIAPELPNLDNFLKQIRKQGEEATKIYEDIMKNLRESIKTAGVQTQMEAAESLGNILGSIISGQKLTLGKILGEALNLLAGYLQKLAAAHSAAAVAFAITPGMQGLAAKEVQSAAALMLASGLVKGFSAGVSKLATGGAVYKPTAALIGDNMDARTNPEAVFRLDQFVGAAERMMGKGSGYGTVQFEIAGTKLVGVLDNANRAMNEWR